MVDKSRRINVHVARLDRHVMRWLHIASWWRVGEIQIDPDAQWAIVLLLVVEHGDRPFQAYQHAL